MENRAATSTCSAPSTRSPAASHGSSARTCVGATHALHPRDRSRIREFVRGCGPASPRASAHAGDCGKASGGGLHASPAASGGEDPTIAAPIRSSPCCAPETELRPGRVYANVSGSRGKTRGPPGQTSGGVHPNVSDSGGSRASRFRGSARGPLRRGACFPYSIGGLVPRAAGFRRSTCAPAPRATHAEARPSPGRVYANVPDGSALLADAAPELSFVVFRARHTSAAGRIHSNVAEPAEPRSVKPRSAVGCPAASCCAFSRPAARGVHADVAEPCAEARDVEPACSTFFGFVSGHAFAGPAR
jgi:hypothetical protein